MAILEIEVHSPMMKNQVKFTKVSDMVNFIASQFAVVPSFYGSSVTLDAFRISVFPSSLPNVFSMSIPVDGDSTQNLVRVNYWINCIEQICV